MSSLISQERAENQAQMILYHVPSTYSVHLILAPGVQATVLPHKMTS